MPSVPWMKQVEPRSRDGRCAFAASAPGAAAPSAAIVHLDGATAGQMGSTPTGMRADCRGDAGISAGAGFLDAAGRSTVDWRGYSACQARHAARAWKGDALVGLAAYP